MVQKLVNIRNKKSSLLTEINSQLKISCYNLNTKSRSTIMQIKKEIKLGGLLRFVLCCPTNQEPYSNQELAVIKFLLLTSIKGSKALLKWPSVLINVKFTQTAWNIVTKIQIKNKSEPLLDKNKEIFHINQSVRHAVIFNLQCEFFLWLKFKLTEKTTNYKQNQVEPRHNINITIKRILQRYTMVKHKTSFQQ